MRRQHDADPVVGYDLHQALQELAPGQRIEAGHGLVEDKELGTLGHGQGQRQLGLLAARQRAGSLLGVEVEVVDPPAGQVVVPPGIHVRAEAEVVLDGEAGIGGSVLRHEADPGQLRRVVRRGSPQHLDAAGTRGQQADGEVEQGGLAGAVGADQADDVTGRDLEVALVERPLSAVALAQAPGAEGPRSPEQGVGLDAHGICHGGSRAPFGP